MGSEIWDQRSGILLTETLGIGEKKDLGPIKLGKTSRIMELILPEPPDPVPKGHIPIFYPSPWILTPFPSPDHPPSAKMFHNFQSGTFPLFLVIYPRKFPWNSHLALELQGQSFLLLDLPPPLPGSGIVDAGPGKSQKFYGKKSIKKIKIFIFPPPKFPGKGSREYLLTAL